MISALAKWLSEDTPVNKQEIEMVFPITGHSFLPPDRGFAHIEKIAKKKDSIVTLNDFSQN